MFFSHVHITIKNMDLCFLLLLHGINKSVYLHTHSTYLDRLSSICLPKSFSWRDMNKCLFTSGQGWQYKAMIFPPSSAYWSSAGLRRYLQKRGWGITSKIMSDSELAPLKSLPQHCGNSGRLHPRNSLYRHQAACLDSSLQELAHSIHNFERDFMNLKMLGSSLDL